MEIKSPYVGFKTVSTTPLLSHLRSTSSRFGGSRPKTSIDEGIKELDEKTNGESLQPHSESPTDLNRIRIDITNVDVSHLLN